MRNFPAQFTETHRSSIRWLPCVNVSGETIPPFALLRYVGMTDDGFIQVNKPNEDDKADGVNDGTEIAVDSTGMTSTDFPNWVAFEDTEESGGGGSGSPDPVVGEEWGPAAGQWYLRSGFLGFKVVGVRSERGLAFACRTYAPVDGGSGGSGYIEVQFVECVQLINEDS